MTNNNESAGKKENARVLNLILVDESGSMGSIYYPALNGMNRTIKAIKNAQRSNPDLPQFINLITFDSEHYKQHLRNAPAAEARELSIRDYRPSAATPLYDAMGHALTALERHTTPNDAVLVTIITDGYENASHIYTSLMIRELVNRLTEKGWLFTYIGANQNVEEVGNKLGIDQVLEYSADEQGTQAMWDLENENRLDYMDRLARSYKERNDDECLCDVMKKKQSRSFFKR